MNIHAYDKWSELQKIDILMRQAQIELTQPLFDKNDSEQISITIDDVRSQIHQIMKKYE